MITNPPLPAGLRLRHETHDQSLWSSDQSGHHNDTGLLSWLIHRGAIYVMAFCVMFSSQAFAYSTVTVSASDGTTTQQYTIAFTDQNNKVSYNQVKALVQATPWWNNRTLAINLASALGGRLGVLTGANYGPLFAFTENPVNVNVENAAWNNLGISNVGVAGVAVSSGNGWGVTTPGVYAVDPTAMAGFQTSVLGTAKPVLSTVSPNSGTTAGGTSITISGNNFTGATAVTIGGVAVTSFNVVDDTTLTVVTPAGTAGAKSVLVTTPAGANTANNLFTYVAPITTPNAPTIGTVTAGNASASVAFTAPVSNGGAAITGYTATCSTSDGGTQGTATGTSSPLSVTGLTNGKTYVCSVVATNSAGDSTASAASSAVTPATVPNAPVIGTVTAGNASASVAFTAPASNGGASITGYTATCSSSDGGTQGTATGTSSPLSVTGLTNGKTYVCSVVATNNVGNSSASAASNSVTPLEPTPASIPTLSEWAMLFLASLMGMFAIARIRRNG